MNQQENSAGGALGGSGADTGESFGGSGREAQAKTVEKHVVMASGIVAGDVDTYNANYYNIYCDLDTLKQMLKKEFCRGAIPGQPTTKSGKPYKEFCYSYAQVKVDELDQVNAVAEMIRGMGYEVETNAGISGNDEEPVCHCTGGTWRNRRSLSIGSGYRNRQYDDDVDL